MMKGSITIYLLLTLILVAAIICLLTESARVSCIRAKLRGITYMAADSCFAEYAREVFDDYGIMALWKNDSELTASFNGYVRKNLDFSDIHVYRDADLYLMQQETCALGNVVRLTDQGGMPFNLQVYEYMDYFLVEEALEKFIEYIDIYGTGSKVAGFVKKIGEYSDIFIRTADCVARIQQTVDKVRSMAYNPRSILSDMEYGLSQYLETDDESYISIFNEGYWELKGGKNSLQRQMRKIGEQTDDFYSASGAARAALRELQDLIDTEGDEYDPELKESLQNQINDLMVRTSDTDTDFYSIGKNREVASNIEMKTDSLDYFLSSVSTGDVKDNAQDYLDTVRIYLDYFSDADTDDLGLNADVYTGERQDPGFISVISNLFSKGLLKAVAGSNVSNKKIQMKELPSAKESRSGSSPEHSDPWNTLKFCEYVLGHFGCYTNVLKDDVLAYETEYVISGKASDKENLKNVAEKLVVMRSGLNMTSFMKDGAKLKEADLLARAVIGFTGMELLVQIVKMVIISAWCIAEALCDVKALMEGKRVAVIKNSNNWAVSAEGLSSFRKTLVPAVTDEAGLSYEDHLRILLYLTGRNDRTMRTMDLIQANACEKYNSLFRMEECVASAQFHAAYSAGTLFSDLGFVRNIARNGTGRYFFSCVQKYEYTAA